MNELWRIQLLSGGIEELRQGHIILLSVCMNAQCIDLNFPSCHERVCYFTLRNNEITSGVAVKLLWTM